MTPQEKGAERFLHDLVELRKSRELMRPSFQKCLSRSWWLKVTRGQPSSVQLWVLSLGALSRRSISM